MQLKQLVLHSFKNLEKMVGLGHREFKHILLLCNKNNETTRRLSGKPMINFALKNPCSLLITVIKYKSQFFMLTTTHARNLKLYTRNNECWGFAFKNTTTE